MTRALVVAVLIVVGSSAFAAQDARQASVTLKAAIAAEQIESDLPKAIGLYERALKEATGDRTLVPQILLRLAQAQEKAGRSADARGSYERIVREFADSGESALAKSALRAYPAGSRPDVSPNGRGAIDNQAELPFRSLAPDVLKDAEASVRVSPDGRWIAKTSRENGLVLRNLLLGSERVVTGIPPWSNRAAGPVWSPDSAWVAFWSFDGGSATAIRAVNIATLKPVTVTEWQAGSAGPRFAWSSDSELIGYVRGRLREGNGACTPMPSNADSCMRELQVADVTGKNPPVAVWAGDDLPSLLWAPAGRTLAFIALNRIEKTAELHLASLGDGSNRVVPLPMGSNLLSWTRDDHLWLYRRNVEYLRVSATDGTVARVLESSDAWIGAAPDGAAVVVLKSSGRLAVRRTSDGQERLLTTGSGREMQAMLSPDGRLVFFASNRDGRWAYYVAPVEAAPVPNPVQLARLDGVPTDSPSTVYGDWSGQGVVIANAPFREFHIARVGIDVAGRRLTGPLDRLTVTWSESFSPTVAPDGSQVAFNVTANGRQAIAVTTPNGDRERIVVEHDRVKLRWRGNDELLFSEGAVAAAQLATSFRIVNLSSGAIAKPAFAELPVDLERERLLDWDYLPGTDEIFFVTGTPVAAGIGYRAPYQFQRFSLRDGSHRVVATRDQFDYPTGTIRVSRDGRFAAFTARGSVQIMSLDDPLQVRSLPAGPGYLSSIAWSEDGRDLLACNLGGRCLLIAIESGQATMLGSPPSPGAEMRWLDAQWLPGGTSILVNQGGVRQVWYSFEGVTVEAVRKLTGR